jgi:integrase
VETQIFTPEQFAKILHAAPPSLIPILAIGGFAGMRKAEMDRLDWNAVDLERKMIEVRAGQAKTASRRIIPISDNLLGWLKLAPGEFAPFVNHSKPLGIEIKKANLRIREIGIEHQVDDDMSTPVE